MSLNWSALIVPTFILFAGLEFLIARQKKLNVFSFDESVTNISIGIAERLLSIFITLSFYDVVKYIHDNYGIFDIPANPLTFILLLLAADLVWYWYHRLGHEVNVLWAAHVVHHQSEDFNYTVSARITVFQGIIRNCFWCILPLMGFAPYMVTTVLIVHGAYSFFTHTQVVGKLGWLEKILVTPSHHRVHHGANEKYLNKNYGDIFIFWDKLFGTYQPEEERPVYGLTHPLRSQSFLWAHFHYYLELMVAASRKKNLREKIFVWFDKPESVDQNIRVGLERRFLRKTHQGRAIEFNQYVVWQVLILLVILFLTVLFSNAITALEFTGITAFVLITLINCGAILEQKRYIFYIEYIRLWIILGLAVAHFDDYSIIFIGAVFTVLTVSSSTVRDRYFQIIYSEKKP